MPFPTVWPGSPNARATDPLTSHAAADTITEDISAASQAAVLDALSSVLVPLCDQEIARIVNRETIRFSESRLRTARHELEELGLVRSPMKVKLAGARAYSRAWQITPLDERAEPSDEPAPNGPGSEDWALESPGVNQ